MISKFRFPFRFHLCATLSLWQIVSTTCVSRWDKEASLTHPLTRMVLTSSCKALKETDHG
jgi:hypothetical protein